MNNKFIPDREEYEINGLTEDLKLSEFFYAFQQNFMSYIEENLSQGKTMLPLFNYPPELNRELEKLLSTEKKEEFPNFNRYLGELERACHVAQTLSKEYDLGFGMAKKGTWLSYVFQLHGFPSYEKYAIRGKGGRRFIFPLHRMNSDQIKNKKILLFDNDVVTGGSVKKLSDSLLDRGADKVSLLLIYKNTRQKIEALNFIVDKLLYIPRIIGETKLGEYLMDTSPSIPSSIHARYFLEENFYLDRKYLDNLWRILKYNER